MNRFEVEYTDTFGGEPNYSWVESDVVEWFECPDRQDCEVFIAKWREQLDKWAKELESIP